MLLIRRAVPKRRNLFGGILDGTNNWKLQQVPYTLQQQLQRAAQVPMQQLVGCAFNTDGRQSKLDACGNADERQIKSVQDNAPQTWERIHALEELVRGAERRRSHAGNPDDRVEDPLSKSGIAAE